MQSRFKTATTAKAAGSAAGIRTVSRAAASTKAPATRAKGSLSSAMDAHAIEDDSHSGTTLYMRNRWRAHVSGAVRHRKLRSKTAARRAAASTSVGAASGATAAGRSLRPAAPSANRCLTKARATCTQGSPSSSSDSDENEDYSDSGTTLYMRNRWRAYVSGAEYVDRDLGYGSSDDDRSSRSSSPPSYPRSSHADVEVFLDDEPFQEDETVVAEWRIGSYARSTIVRIVCCRFRFFFFLIWCRVRQAGP